MKSKYLLSAIVALLVMVVAFALYLWRDVDLQDGFYFTEASSGAVSTDTSAIVSIGAFPSRGSMRNLVELRPGAIFNINSTAPYSRITRQSLNRLIDDPNSNVDSTTMLFFARKGSDGLRLIKKVYLIDMAVYGYSIVTDSTGRSVRMDHTIAPIGTIKNMRFVLAEPGDINTLGLDFLSKVVLEQNFSDKTITFHNRVPERFQFMGHMHGNGAIGDMLSIGEPYFVDMKVDQFPYTFLLNTTLKNMSIRIPYSEYRINKMNDKLEMHSTDDKSEQFMALVDSGAWIDYGTRGGIRRVYYVEDDNPSHEVNPLTFFRQDIVIDFIGKRIYLRPQYDLAPQTNTHIR